MGPRLVEATISKPLHDNESTAMSRHNRVRLYCMLVEETCQCLTTQQCAHPAANIARCTRGGQRA
eukprot:5583977-Lingulodinium_polyedra.AAC.1